MRCQTVDGGVDKGAVSLRISAMWLGRKKGRKVLAVGESFGGRDLSGVLSQAKIHMYHYR